MRASTLIPFAMLLASQLALAEGEKPPPVTKGGEIVKAGAFCESLCFQRFANCLRIYTPPSSYGVPQTILFPCLRELKSCISRC